MWLEHRVCVCWRAGVAQNAAGGVGDYPSQANAGYTESPAISSQSSNVPERCWGYVNMTWLELHFEKMVVLCRTVCCRGVRKAGERLAFGGYGSSLVRDDASWA